MAQNLEKQRLAMLIELHATVLLKILDWNQLDFGQNHPL